MIEELIRKLADKFEEEIKDSEAYLEMSKEAIDNGMTGEGQILKDIAHEECVHAKHLKMILSKHDAFDDGMRDMWEKSNEKRM